MTRPDAIHERDAEKLVEEIEHARRYLIALEEALRARSWRRASDAITNLGFGIDELRSLRERVS